jgi:hypothetical protein
LPASAQIKHGLALARIRECLLALGKGVLQDHEDPVVAERGFGLRRAAAGRPAKRLHHGLRDRVRELPVGQSPFRAHRRPRPARGRDVTTSRFG